MRKWIDIVSEKIVYRDQAVERTVIAINPTPVEWRTNFPTGAGGVICQNGDLVVGNGPVLAHDVILDKASVSQDSEKYRLQLGPQRGFVEIWLSDEVVQAYLDSHDPTDKQHILDDAIDNQFGVTYAVALGEVSRICQRLSPNYQTRLVLLNESAECFVPGDEEWRDSCF